MRRAAVGLAVVTTLATGCGRRDIADLALMMPPEIEAAARHVVGLLEDCAAAVEAAPASCESRTAALRALVDSEHARAFRAVPNPEMLPRYGPQFGARYGARVEAGYQRLEAALLHCGNDPALTQVFVDIGLTKAAATP